MPLATMQMYMVLITTRRRWRVNNEPGSESRADEDSPLLDVVTVSRWLAGPPGRFEADDDGRDCKSATWSFFLRMTTIQPIE